MRIPRTKLMAMVAAALMAVTGCLETPADTAVAVTVTPVAVTLPPGGTQVFTATVTGASDTSVTWNTTCGSIVTAGNTATYTAPTAEGTCAIIATSNADPTAAEDAVITIQTTPAGAVALTPSAATLQPGESQPFTATVTGHADTTVTWTTTCGTVSGTSNTITYTAPTTEGTCTLTATSNADPSESANATITITAPDTITVTLTPTNATLRIGQTQDFTATTTGTSNTNITWTTTGGTITGSGNIITYTAPNVLDDYTLTATSTADPSQSASATIRVVAHPDEIWARQLGTADSDRAYGVAVDTAGNVYVAGSTSGDLYGPLTGLSDGFLVKFDGDGHHAWARKLGSNAVHTFWRDVAVGPAGHVVVVGNADGSLPGAGSHQGDYDVIIGKYAPDGTPQWLVQRGTTTYDAARRVAIDADGNVFVAGYTLGALAGVNQGASDAFLMKLDPTGVHQWTYQFGTAADDITYGVAIGTAGNAVVAGDTAGSLYATHQGISDVFAAKVSTSGSLIWGRQFGTSDADSGYDVAIDLLGNVMVAGSTKGSLPGPGLNQGGMDAFVASFTANGTPRWARQFGTPGSDRFSAVAVGLAGNVVAAGYTTGAYAEPNPSHDQQGIVVKLDADGQQLWARQLSAWPTASSTEADDIAIKLAGNVLVVGSTWGNLAGPHQGLEDALVIELAP